MKYKAVTSLLILRELLSIFGRFWTNKETTASVLQWSHSVRKAHLHHAEDADVWERRDDGRTDGSKAGLDMQKVQNIPESANESSPECFGSLVTGGPKRSGRGFWVTQGRNALWVCACEGHHHEEYCSDYITSILHRRFLRSRHVRITAIKSLIDERVSIRIIDQLMDRKDDQ